jgi:hypothetical protein
LEAGCRACKKITVAKLKVIIGSNLTDSSELGCGSRRAIVSMMMMMMMMMMMNTPIVIIIPSHIVLGCNYLNYLPQHMNHCSFWWALQYPQTILDTPMNLTRNQQMHGGSM